MGNLSFTHRYIRLQTPGFHMIANGPYLQVGTNQRFVLCDQISDLVPRKPEIFKCQQKFLEAII